MQCASLIPRPLLALSTGTWMGTMLTFVTCCIVCDSVYIAAVWLLVVHTYTNCVTTFTCAGNVNGKVNGGTNRLDNPDNEDDEPERQSYSAWHFLTIFLVIAAVAVTSYVCVHNRKKVRENGLALGLYELKILIIS